MLLPINRLTGLLLVVCAVACRPTAGPTAGPASVQVAPDPAAVPLPNQPDSLKFLVFGDFGVNSTEQYQLADQMARLRDRFAFELALLVGDNLYGAERPQDFVTKFERPYKPLLDRGVKFYASLGNHDSREQRYYKLFNMGGKLYYSFEAPRQDVRFYALESTYPDPEQLAWIEKELKSTNDDWKITFFHHPLYSSGERHGSDLRLRDALEPTLVQNNVSVVFTGHDHFYERVKPQKGIVYFVVGSGGQLREGNIDRTSQITAKGVDNDQVFLAAEIRDDQMTFQAIGRTGRVLDSGVVSRRQLSK
jgi:hypothetical protein